MAVVDPALHQMTEMMLPRSDSPQSFSELFLDYFPSLFCAHVAYTYAPSFGAGREYRGGLAPWQKRRATELLAEHLDGSLRLADRASSMWLVRQPFREGVRQSFSNALSRPVERIRGSAPRSARLGLCSQGFTGFACAGVSKTDCRNAFAKWLTDKPH